MSLHVGGVIASLLEESPHGENVPRWKFPETTAAPSRLWLGARFVEFLTFLMEPMWPDSVGWFTFCQTRVCEAQKNWLASRKCQTAVTGLRRHCITWEESWQRLTCVLRLTGRTLVCINNVTCKFIDIRRKLTKCIVGAMWKKMRWEPPGHVSSEATLAADRGEEGAMHRSSKCQ